MCDGQDWEQPAWGTRLEPLTTWVTLARLCQQAHKSPEEVRTGSRSRWELTQHTATWLPSPIDVLYFSSKLRSLPYLPCSCVRDFLKWPSSGPPPFLLWPLTPPAHSRFPSGLSAGRGLSWTFQVCVCRQLHHFHTQEDLAPLGNE